MGGKLMAGVLAGALVLGVGCEGEVDVEVGGSPTAAPTGSPSPTPEETGGATISIDPAEVNFHDAADVSGQASVEVELDDFYFEPTVLVGEPGQTLTLRLRHDGDAPHTFTLEEQGIDVELEGEASEEVEVTLPEAGAVRFVCRFHEGRGMWGALGSLGSIELPDDDLETG